MHKSLIVLTLFSLLLTYSCLQEPDTYQVVDYRLNPFHLDQVRLLESPFKDAMELDKKYLLSLDMDRFLVDFRKVNGLTTTVEPYGGWEQEGLNGHTLGHYLSACAIMHAATGEEEFVRRVSYIVDQLSEIQVAGGSGYIGGIPPDFFEKSAFDPENEVRNFRFGGVWSPWYNIHKVFAGLLDAYTCCENKKAVEVVSGLADWAVHIADQLADSLFTRMLDCEFGGMNDALAELYAITGNKEYLHLAIRFDHDRVFNPLEKGEDKLKQLHANTQIPKIIGAARIYELTGDEKYWHIAKNFWDIVVDHHTYIQGGNSSGEYFGPPDSLAYRISDATCETCNTYNMLKLTRHLLMLTGEMKYAEYYERALYNHILASQDHETGMMLYFASLEPGYYKIFNSPEHSFWCCTGTGMENHAKYGNSIYFHDSQSVWINLFIASELKWEEKGLVLRQETDFPESENITVTILSASGKVMPMNIRIPCWVAPGVSVQVNNEEVRSEIIPGSYVSVSRKWNEGDVIQIKLPMDLHVSTLPDDKAKFAILFGPVVLAGNLGETDLPREWHYPDDNVGNVEETRQKIEVPVISGDLDNPGGWIRSARDKSLSFRTVNTGIPEDVELIPFYKINYERYTIYWDHVQPDRLP
ncbi:MAG: hypothetical protein AMS27_04575 [Bacteroides sp. SM23_62_1]|nr:MAG: hypothetical protein AMS27_04575 [Bacteroides sp. SM23_62_1]